MKILVLIQVVVVILMFGNISAQEIEIVNLKLESENEFNANLDFDLNFEIVNNSKSDIYVPDPSVNLDEYDIPYPKTFSFLLTPNECDMGFLEYKFVGVENLILIRKGERVKMKINPKKYEKFNCYYEKGEIELQLVLFFSKDEREGYMAKELSKSNEVLKDVFQKIPVQKVLSKKLMFEIN